MVYWSVVLCSIDLQLILVCGPLRKKFGANLWGSWYLTPCSSLQGRVSVFVLETAPKVFLELFCSIFSEMLDSCHLFQVIIRHRLFNLKFNFALIGTKTLHTNTIEITFSWFLLYSFFYLLICNSNFTHRDIYMCHQQKYNFN